MISRNTLLIHLPQHAIFVAALFGASPAWLLLTYASWAVLGYFGFSVWYHRYFAHRAFKTHRAWEYVWGYLGLLVGRGSPINIASLHAVHHANADTEKDPHSPSKGWMWSYFTWAERHEFKLNLLAAKHLLRDPYMRFLDRHYMKLFWGTAFLLAIIDWRVMAFGMMGAGVLHYHIEALVNTICHDSRFGTQDFVTGDNSRNVRGAFNWFCLGTGLHNNHHQKQTAYHYEMLPGDFDLARYIVPLFVRA
jgi:stearoyl-CoA desaturase (delta-9 desaturase)